MPISRRFFLRDGAQAIGAVSLLCATTALTGCASTGPTGTGSATTTSSNNDQGARRAVRSVASSNLKVVDVAGLALIQGAGCNVVALGGADGALMIDGGLA